MTIPSERPGRRRDALRAIILFVVALGLVGVSCSPNRDPMGEPPGTTQEDDLLVVVSPTGRITRGDTTGSHVLELDTVNDVLVFSDRPVRKAWRTTAAEIAAKWDELFADSLPNAGITAERDGVTFDEAVEITSFEVAGGGVTMTVTGIGDDRDALVDAELTDVSAFIDSIVLCSNPRSCQAGTTTTTTTAAPGQTTCRSDGSVFGDLECAWPRCDFNAPGNSPGECPDAYISDIAATGQISMVQQDWQQYTSCDWSSPTTTPGKCPDGYRWYRT